MTNEAVIVELLGDTKGEPISYTVADGVAVAKGTIMHVLDPKTAVKSSGAAGAAHGTHYFAGIAAAEKVKDDTSTKLALHTRGIFDLYYGGAEAISAGQLVIISGSNTIALADGDASETQGVIVGKALEDAATGTPETIQVLVGVR